MSDPTKDVLDSISRNVSRITSGPIDPALMSAARMEKGHISDKAVMDYYDHLVQMRNTRFPEPRRSFWDRLFGW
jgi:hypothetical protein